MLTRAADRALRECVQAARSAASYKDTYRTQPLEPQMPVRYFVRRIARIAPPTLALVPILVALSMALPRSAAAQQPIPPMQPPPTLFPHIATTGTGEVRLTPDRATVLIAVETRGATAKDAGAANARIQTATLNALQALGIPRDRLSTVGFDVEPDYRHDPQGQTAPKVIGYVVRNTIRADVRQLDMLSRVIDTALANGANRINSIQFLSSKSEEAQRQALANAVADARGQAEAMAKAAGGTLGTLLELNSQGYVRPVEMMAQVAFSDARAAAAPSTPINPGELVVTATVMGRWSFK